MGTLNIPHSFTNGYVANANEVNTNFQNVKTFAETQVLQADTKTVFLAPVGSITMYTGASAPAGWLLCDGVTSTAPYPALATLVGATTPNLQSRFPIGMGALAVKSTGGSTTITANNLPAHSHPNTATASTSVSVSDPGHSHTLDTIDINYTGTAMGVFEPGIALSAGDEPNVVNSNTTGITASATTTVTMTNANNTTTASAYYQPYYVVNFIIKHD